VSPRAYHSVRRTAAAAATREAVLAAALRLFRERGFAATAVADVAADAQVSVNTVYAGVGGKPQLLVALIQDAAADPAIDAAMAAVAAASSGDAVLRLLAAGTREVFQRHDWVLGALYDNAAADDAIRAVQVTAEDAYRRRVTEVAGRLAALGALADGVGARQAADVLWYFFGFRSWRSLRELRWSWDRAEDWLVAQAGAALLSARG
jgi:AcrR family transcriptional regulator